MSHGNITIQVQLESKHIANMVKEAGLVGDNAGDGEAASLLQPMIRGVLNDWRPALVEEACHRMLKAREEL